MGMSSILGGFDGRDKVMSVENDNSNLPTGGCQSSESSKNGGSFFVLPRRNVKGIGRSDNAMIKIKIILSRRIQKSYIFLLQQNPDWY
jgi:hypothetical protein